jgi:hypothetical protein
MRIDQLSAANDGGEAIDVLQYYTLGTGWVNAPTGVCGRARGGYVHYACLNDAPTQRLARRQRRRVLPQHRLQ